MLEKGIAAAAGSDSTGETSMLRSVAGADRQDDAPSSPSNAARKRSHH
jgi:hypothetical protein